METLFLVLCHCRPNFIPVTRHHSAILQRLVRVLHTLISPIIRFGQAVLSLDKSLRLDFVAVDETSKAVAIIDVTMQFDKR
jgi:hypothetical protein